jgi:hypothetical protein
VRNISIVPLGLGDYKINWVGSESALYYVVEISDDDLDIDDLNKVWTEVGQTTQTNFEVALETDETFIRVAGVNIGLGPWSYFESELYTILIDDENNILTTDDGGATLVG